MRVLLSLESLAGFGGTETYSLTTAIELERLGHDVSLYSPDRGEMATFARDNGVRVLALEELPRSCELLVCSDAATCHELAGRYRDSVTLFVAHSADHMLQAPPQLGDRCQAVVVLNERVRRAVDARAWHAPVVRLRQPIDLLRYWKLGSARAPSRTALLLANHLSASRVRMIEAACQANGIELRWVGASTAPTPTPEFAIADAALVIGLGRSVLETMATGRAAFVYGVRGGDGWVTPERYPAMEADGFTGTSSPELIIDADRLTDELAAWRENMGDVNRDLASAHHSAHEHAVELVKLARNLDHLPAGEPALSDELAHLIRLQRQSELEAFVSSAEAERLRSLLDEADARATHFQSEARAAREQLEAFRRTRRYRLATLIGSPLDRMRARPRTAAGTEPPRGS